MGVDRPGIGPKADRDSYFFSRIIPNRPEMLSFSVYSNGRPVDAIDLAGAYVVGSDDVPLRADINLKNGVIACQKRAAGPAGLALPFDIPGFGRILLETIRVQERERPYILQVELARGRLMRLLSKMEDWGLADYAPAVAILAKVEAGRDALIRALQAGTPAESAGLAEESLRITVPASEELAQLHAELFLSRRKQTGAMPKRALGCSIGLEKPNELNRKQVVGGCDFVNVPIVWRDIEPTEQNFNWKSLDAWVDVLMKQRIPMRGLSLLSFHETNIPDWLRTWENDFDTIRDLAFEHVRRVLSRYGQYITSWSVVSGLHASNAFSFNFEQLMELTRMATALTKQLAPRAVALLDLTSPWGEYYARNQRTIPPLLFAEAAGQGGVNFDGFGLQLRFGPGVDGMYVRDMFQISSMLDQFAKVNKPLHITAVQVPSGTAVAPSGDAKRPAPAINGGTWREPWSETVQATWLRRFAEIALSKPFVESVSWGGLWDTPQSLVANGGLLRADFAAKAGFVEFTDLRAELSGKARRTASNAAS